LFYDGTTLECRIVKVSAGSEIQYFYRGDLYHCFLHPSRAEAENEARQKRSELIQAGWMERDGRSPLQRTW